MRKLFALVLVVLLIGAIAEPVLAHTTSQQGILVKSSNAGSHKYYGGEEIGWIINEEGHTNGTELKYRFATNVLNSVKTLVSSGAALWTNTNQTVTISKDNSANGIVEVMDLSSGTVAQTVKQSVDSNGHVTQWVISLNTDYLVMDPDDPPPSHIITKQDVAHEFGHVIGLRDLYDSSNINKLMYSSIDSTATVPNTWDIRGARLILGRHYSHTWEYVFYQTNSSGNNTHRRRCSYCHGIKYNSVEACTYSGGVCTKCGIPQGYSPSGIGLPTATAILPDPYGEERKSYALLI